MSQERSLEKKGLMEAYNGVFQEYVDRGVWKEIPEDELRSWKEAGNPIHYVGHHCVMNDASKSTPIRIVVDSTVKNNYQGPSLNDVLIKGPNALNNLYQCLMRWRSYEVGLIFDLSKAYHQLWTGPIEKFTLLVVWRNGDKTKDFTTYGHECEGMGDKPAALGLEIGKDIASEKGEDIDPEAARKLKEDTYADDGLTGGDKEVVKRMVGQRHVHVDGTVSYDGTMTQILATVSFKAKSFIASGEEDPEVLSKLGKVLGHAWDPPTDTISFKLTINLTGKNGASKNGPDLTVEDVERMMLFRFTKRI